MLNLLKLKLHWLTLILLFACGRNDTQYAPQAVGTQGLEAIKKDSRKRIFIVGSTHGLGALLVNVSLDRARRYQELNRYSLEKSIVEKENILPEQFVFIMTGEVADEKYHNLQINSLKNSGKILIGEALELNSKDYLTSEGLMKILGELENVASIDFFTHHAASLGPRLEEDWLPQHWFNLIRCKNKEECVVGDGVAELGKIFTSDAFVNFHGCNGGIPLAPELSKLWNIPVSGALSATNFATLYSDGKFYSPYEHQYPDNEKVVRSNQWSFEESLPCLNGSCRRMKPENTVYNGRWGSFGHGIPFMKFFCNWNNPDLERCEKAMVTSLMAFPSIAPITPSSNLDQFKANLFDFLCPIDALGYHKGSMRSKCIDSLEKQEALSLFKGKEPYCDLNGCDVEIYCDRDYYCRSRYSSTSRSPASDNTLREYMHYLSGFERLKNEN